MLKLDVIENPHHHFEWRSISENNEYPVRVFENALLFGGKTFWEVEQQIQ